MHKRSTLIVLFFSLSLAAGNVFASTAEKIEKLNAFELLAFVESLDQLEVTPENCRLKQKSSTESFKFVKKFVKSYPLHNKLPLSEELINSAIGAGHQRKRINYYFQ